MSEGPGLDALDTRLTDAIRTLDRLVPASEEATHAVIALSDGRRDLILYARSLEARLSAATRSDLADRLDEHVARELKCSHVNAPLLRAAADRVRLL